MVHAEQLNTMKKPKLSHILKLFNDLNVNDKFIEKRKGKGVCFIFDVLDKWYNY